MNGLQDIWWMETEGAPLEQILRRTYAVYRNTDALFPDSRETYQYAWWQVIGRVVKLLKKIMVLIDHVLNFRNSLFDYAWAKIGWN